MSKFKKELSPGNMVSLSLNKKILLKELGVQESEELLHKIAMMGAEVD